MTATPPDLAAQTCGGGVGAGVGAGGGGGLCGGFGPARPEPLELE